MEAVAREVLAVDSVRKSFGGRPVLKSASFWAREGRIVTLMGRNGSGKTTLLRIAVGEVLAETGVVRFLGKTYLHPRLPVLARRGLYYLEESPRLPNTFKIGGLFELIRKKRRTGPPIESVVGVLRLDGLLDRKFYQLSGGEGRRAALAAAVISNPACLLVDEPFTEIAPSDQRLIAKVLRGLSESGTAIVASGHDVVPLLEVSDEIIWSVAGTTHGIGTPEEARSHPQFVREYLGWKLWAPRPQAGHGAP